MSKRHIYLESNSTPNLEIQKKSKNPLLEKCLTLWYSNLVGKKVLVTNEMIVDQAKKFGHLMSITDYSSFELTVNWMDNLKRDYDQSLPERKMNYFNYDDLENSNFDEHSSIYNNEKNGNRNETDAENLEIEEDKFENSENDGDSNYLNEIAELAKESNYNDMPNETNYESSGNYNEESFENVNLNNGEAQSFDMSWKKKRVVLDLDAKRQIILFHDQHPSWSQQKLADYFSEKFQFKTKIARNTISTILSKRNVYLQTETNGINNFSRSPIGSKSNRLPYESNGSNDNVHHNGQIQFSGHNNSSNDYNLTIEEIIELAKESEYNETMNNSNDDDENEAENYESTSFKIEPKVYSKGDALIGIENIQGLLIQADLLDESDLEYISKLRSKLDLIN